eukprot:CAMPEP_0168602542 /NCGR_PEP_ID=MMETSP0420-20121227/14162_1 /TAXON_ID=498008 /ORGANISM="Pessonella sp." /LENGTH=196 /DNA_ID=CAMNT_0008641285 /DNA_START=696 /DNA_END=1282 /DNA_ORIENTATION=-
MTTIDGELLPSHPYLMLRDMPTAPVPLIVGKTRDEGTVFVYPNYADKLSEDMYRLYLTSYLPAMALDDMMKVGDCRAALAAFAGDFALICPTVWLANQFASSSQNQRVYSYQFMNASENMQRTAPILGAYHSCDTAFTFGTVPDATPVDEQLTRNVHDYWFSFVRDGVPSGEQLWPSYTAEPHTEMLFGVPLSKRV